MKQQNKAVKRITARKIIEALQDKEPQQEVYIKKVLGLNEAQEDNSVNYYEPFNLIVEDEDKKQFNILMDYDELIRIAEILEPYLESEKAEAKAEAEMYKDYKQNS